MYLYAIGSWNCMSLLDMVGNTPMMSMDGIHVKLEYLNPSGSIKDRMAKYIVEQAEKKGLLKKGYTIVEATSGNTGIAFSLAAALKGYKMVAIMPKGLSEERVKIMHALGARVVRVKKDCFSCAIAAAEELGKRPGTYLPRQFANVWNPQEHEKHLAKEIIKQAKGIKIDAVVAGVGTGGTIIGVGKALKKKFPKCKVIAIEPDECHVLESSGIGSVWHVNKKTKACRHHRIEGIGDGLIPPIIEHNREIIDEVIEIRSTDAVTMSKKLARQGYFVGPSSGANLLGALKVRKKDAKKYKNIVTFFCDSGDRYMSEL